MPGKLCVICWTSRGKRHWRWQCAVRHHRTHPGLFGLFRGWGTCSSIRINARKLCTVFSMPFVDILPFRFCGRYMALCITVLFYFSIFIGLDYLIRICIVLGSWPCLPATWQVHCCSQGAFSLPFHFSLRVTYVYLSIVLFLGVK